MPKWEIRTRVQVEVRNLYLTNYIFKKYFVIIVCFAAFDFKIVIPYQIEITCF